MIQPKDPMFIHNELRKRREKLRLTIREVAKKADISEMMIGGWERAQYDPRKAATERLVRYASALEWTFDELAETLGLHTDTQVQRLARVKETERKPLRMIPKYRTVAAGQGFEDAEFLGYIYLPIDESGDAAYKVDGSSMEPDIQSSDTVIIEIGVFDLGDVVVAYVPEAGMVIKRLVVDNQDKRTVLKSQNPDYGKLIAEGADIKGKVVEIRRRLNHH